MMKQIMLIVFCAAMLTFQSCNSPLLMTPEAKAQEVCECVKKNFKEKKFGSMIRQCQELEEKYSDELSGDARKKFEEALEDCSADMLEDGLNNLFN